jgi:hypothetical protein
MEAPAKLKNGVTPATAGVQKAMQRLDSRLRGNDVKRLLQEAQ